MRAQFDADDVTGRLASLEDAAHNIFGEGSVLVVDPRKHFLPGDDSWSPVRHTPRVAHRGVAPHESSLDITQGPPSRIMFQGTHESHPTGANLIAILHNQERGGPGVANRRARTQRITRGPTTARNTMRQAAPNAWLGHGMFPWDVVVSAVRAQRWEHCGITRWSARVFFVNLPGGSTKLTVDLSMPAADGTNPNEIAQMHLLDTEGAAGSNPAPRTTLVALTEMHFDPMK